MSDPAAAEEPPRCPRCGHRGVIAERSIGSACVPFPAMEAIRCGACGHPGTRVRLGARVIVSWGSPIR
ncbi:MAG: hypothetical protein R3B09_11960 [Nannocystaceae bacterium]